MNAAMIALRAISSPALVPPAASASNSRSAELYLITYIFLPRRCPLLPILHSMLALGCQDFPVLSVYGARSSCRCRCQGLNVCPVQSWLFGDDTTMLPECANDNATAAAHARLRLLRNVMYCIGP